ncbi:MAG: hypothetical protein ABI678_08855 [Kofleriaceae bacterium]
MLRSSLVVVVALLGRTADAAPGAKCPAPEFRQLDFWLGDWDTFEVVGDTSKSIARTHVDLIAGGCAVHELYEQTDGLIGDSILSYDPVKKTWQQTWVTNGGSLMVLAGAFKSGAVTMEGEYHSAAGKTFKTRITWKTEGAGVRESSVSSKDGGKTWEPNFDVLFKKHK